MSLYVGDVREGLRSFLAAGVRAQTCVTSPPYWGLRDYGVVGQIGLEPTIAEYVAGMVEVFRLVRDVLEDDGVLFLNLGDSYSNTGKSGGGEQGDRWQRAGGRTDDCAGTFKYATDGLKPKDLCGIPWRVAFALQADGWWLRQDIIWAKPNPMPESVTDRCTKSHEYLFLLAKNERYYYDAAAIAEALVSDGGGGFYQNDSAYRIETQTGGASFGERKREWGRNRRSVWTVTTQPYSEAHFATFPRALVEPCIMAGSRVGDTVLDPFMGSGTVAQVAQDLGRQWIGCELNPEYAKLVDRRTAQQAMALAAD